MFDFRETTAFQTRAVEDDENDDKDDAEMRISKFEEAGYDSTNFIMLLGPIFLIVMLFLMWNILLCLMKKMTQKCGENFCTRYLRKSS